MIKLASVKKMVLLTPLVLIAVALIGVRPVSVSAQTTQDVCEGVQFTGGGSCPGTGSTGRLEGVVRRFLEVLSTIVGIASVALIIFGGFKYITAGGDSGKISSAQSTIIYALVGLVIAGLAQVIVRYVIAVAS